jgi:hypothetical protein
MSFWVGLTLLAAVCFFTGRHYEKDDSDGASRSGMIVYTDALTGCQYLGTITGAITPRLNKDGKIVCVK